ncbi:hypothetical protein ACIBAG_38570 [Streptomyces sp. NPDC051243]|uniref:hypothetical protein n=1 Tax=Streptomyces sp. NPDC051243 TaxID=3365646 RepID=UPI0037B52770
MSRVRTRTATAPANQALSDRQLLKDNAFAVWRNKGEPGAAEARRRGACGTNTIRAAGTAWWNSPEQGRTPVPRPTSPFIASSDE